MWGRVSVQEDENVLQWTVGGRAAVDGGDAAQQRVGLNAAVLDPSDQ